MSKFLAVSMLSLPLGGEAVQKLAPVWGELANMGTDKFQNSRGTVAMTPYLQPHEKLFMGNQYDKVQVFRLNDWKTTTTGTENGIVFVWKSTDEATCYPEKQADLMSTFFANMFDEDYDGNTDSEDVKARFQRNLSNRQAIVVLGCGYPNVGGMNQFVAANYPADQQLPKFYDPALWNTAAASQTNFNTAAQKAAFLIMYDMAWQHVYRDLSIMQGKKCFADAIGQVYVRAGSLGCAQNKADSSAYQLAVKTNFFTGYKECVGAPGTWKLDPTGVSPKTCLTFATAGVKGCWGRVDYVYGQGESDKNEVLSIWNEEDDVADMLHTFYVQLVDSTTTYKGVNHVTTSLGEGTKSVPTGAALIHIPAASLGDLTTIANLNNNSECKNIVDTFTALATTTTVAIPGTIVSTYTGVTAAGDVAPAVTFGASVAAPTVNHKCTVDDSPVKVAFTNGITLECTAKDSSDSKGSTADNSNNTIGTDTNSAGRALTSVGAAVLGVVAAGAALF